MLPEECHPHHELSPITQRCIRCGIHRHHIPALGVTREENTPVRKIEEHGFVEIIKGPMS